MATTEPGQILLKLISACDSFTYSPLSHPNGAASEYYLFALLTTWSPTCTTLKTHGYIPPWVIAQMPWTAFFSIDHHRKILTIPYSTQQTESETIASQLSLARAQKSFRILTGWRNELYPVIGAAGRLVECERAGSALFGITTRGVHCMAFTYASPTTERSVENMRLIIPRRAASKSTYPLMMDNTIAGGMPSKESPWTCLIRETGEETGLSANVAARARPAGTVSYIHIRDERAGGETGLVQAECQYVYDLELDASKEDERPRVHDDEVAGFEVMSVKQAWECLVRDEFKPNCGLVLIDFFVRKGIIRAKGDEWDVVDETLPKDESQGWEVSVEEYAEVLSRLHRRILFEDVEGRMMA